MLKSRVKLFILYLCIMFIAGCSHQKDPNIKAGYVDYEEYFDEGFMDYTDYCKYFYTEKEDNLYIEDKAYTKVTGDNIEIVKDYFDDFPAYCMENSENYDFNSDEVNEGDYYCIIDKSTPDTTNYNVYFYDMSTHILYYIHNND